MKAMTPIRLPGLKRKTESFKDYVINKTYSGLKLLSICQAETPKCVTAGTGALKITQNKYGERPMMTFC